MKATEQHWNVCGDFHSGAKTGLTASPKNAIQKELLKTYKDAIKWAGQPDVLLHMGDGWDGKDEKSNDIDENCLLNQAADCAELICLQRPRKEVILITGTRYHDSHKGQEFMAHCKRCIEYEMLDKHNRKIKVSIRRKLKTTINGWFLIEARHKIGTSALIHGRGTAGMRSQMCNVMNAALSAYEREMPVKWPDLLMFGHAHYYQATENAWGDVVILPCWQALGSVYGDEQCDGHVDLGIVRLTIGAKEADGWQRSKKLYPAGVVQRTESR